MTHQFCEGSKKQGSRLVVVSWGAVWSPGSLLVLLLLT